MRGRPCAPRRGPSARQLGAGILIARAAIAVGCLLSAGVHAQGWDLTGSVGLTHRTLTERAPGGARLLTESGPQLQARLEAMRPLADGSAWAVRGTLTGGDLDYDGQTQAGVPLATTTRHWEGAADVMWRPLAPSAWGEAWLTGGTLVNVRRIHSTPTAGGLDETSSALLAGLRWRSPEFGTGHWKFNLEAEAATSVAHRLHVNYHGLLDDSRFRGARKQLAVLRVVAAPSASPWGWTAEWSGLRQPESAAVGVSRAGVPVAGTTVRQPALTIRDLTLRISRRF